ncbi:pilus assembly protein [Noviherbaspirillum galbum]|uniref:PQQ-binding-like beta-propeller repeat protein n=1 Tax=Noviherbaspirillum galbum TaxID=2709383 RepID=A0A6B3SHZ7_9BURK|nr:PilC/PilY family type IV pilus protein [Noviherbaspirillum galbum]NEX60293.1 PQQ-binding-like beta-propeller repeat protein [Noviherbaspirillum galbum]
MKKYLQPVCLALSLGAAALTTALPSLAEDTDIFKAAATSASGPKILIVLDNTSNWARQSQQWPGGIQQGQAEVRAIQTVVNSLTSTDNINLGLMEFVTNGNANDNGGFVRYAIRDMAQSTNRTNFGTKLTTIFNNINSPSEKRNSRTPYGNLMYDVYNYFAGAASYWGQSAAPNPDTDAAGYSTTYSNFASPLSAADTCTNNYVIFIGNPNSSGPAADDSANTARLAALGGDTTQLRMPGVTTSITVSAASSTELGNTSLCYSSLGAAQTAYGYGMNTSDNVCELYSAKGTVTSASVTDKYTQSCKQYSNGTSDTDTVTATDFQAQCSTFTEGCRLGDLVNNPNVTVVTSGTTAYLSSAPAATAAGAGAAAGLTCPANAISCTYSVDAGQDATGGVAQSNITSNSCYWTGSGGQPSGTTQWSMASNDYGSATCPANYTCSYTMTSMTDANICTTQRTKKAVLNQTLTPKKRYTVTQTATVPGGTCATGSNQYKVLGTNLVQTNVLSTTTVADNGPRNADEWARFMFQGGVPLAGDASNRKSISTYTIDVYNKQPNADHTSLMMSMAKNGGGKYFSAMNEAEIVKALKNILSEIQAVNSTFASASLPVNATNRAQNENQVFIGMFRPDNKPRWFGNLKRYQLINQGGNIELGDNDSPPKLAVNPVTGFVTDCAISYWTSDSATYWQSVTDGMSPTSQLLDPSTIKGKCDGYSPYSDLPDGPLVEKGAVAEVLRKGNNPSGATTWAVNRTIYTRSGSSLTSFGAASGLSSSLVDFISGKDVNNETGGGDATKTRPSIHGDVVHSRPLPINYGGTTGVVVYYGANDGTLRAVEANTGKEKWAFIAPEFYSRLSRLSSDSPNVNVPALYPSDGSNKDYFFDGPLGFYQNSDNTKVWIFPTMRRGGRMLYSFDVTTPDTPSLKWAIGCPNLADDTNCTTGMSGMGQTWSAPRVARIKGYSDTTPVLIVGGGYDACEDDNTKSPACTSPKGSSIYILNANTGDVIRTFTFTGARSMAADITLVDVDADGMADYAYAADTGGNVYRLDFVNYDKTTLASNLWFGRRVAYTNASGADNGRKFLYGPAAYAVAGKVYLAIGSGDREHPLQQHYPYSDVVNRFFVFKDDLSIVATSTAALNLDAMTDLTTNTTCDQTPILPTSASNGWYMKLNQNGQGEQTVTSALIAGGMVYFSTNRPVPAGASCSAQLGEARGYAVNLFTRSGGIGTPDACGGASSGIFTGGGLPPSPVQATVPVGGKNVTVCIGCASQVTGNSVIDSSKVKFLVQPKRRRIYSNAKTDN